MYVLFDILLVVLGALMLWYRAPLGRSMARIQRDQAGKWPWLYPGRLGRWYASEKAWRSVFIPVLAIIWMFVGTLWIWKGSY
jgi:hypothetical protein